MSFGHFSIPPKEHRERKPFQAFARSNELRKSKAKGYGSPLANHSDERRKIADEERTMRNVRALMFLLLFTLLGALAFIALK